MLRVCEWLEVGEQTPIGLIFVGLVPLSDFLLPKTFLMGPEVAKDQIKTKKDHIGN